jgi:hypothetical protein
MKGEDHDRMRVHFYSHGSKISLYEHPKPEPEPGQYLGEVDLSTEEVEELGRMIDEIRAEEA